MNATKWTAIQQKTWDRFCSYYSRISKGLFNVGLIKLSVTNDIKQKPVWLIDEFICNAVFSVLCSWWKPKHIEFAQHNEADSLSAICWYWAILYTFTNKALRYSSFLISPPWNWQKSAYFLEFSYTTEQQKCLMGSFPFKKKKAAQETNPWHRKVILFHVYILAQAAQLISKTSSLKC